MRLPDQNGETLKKKRDNEDINSAISTRVLVRYSTLASATAVDETVLPVAILSGLTVPEKRTYSTPLSSATCFSPLTKRLPFGSTSITVTPMVPVKLLLDEIAPFSSYLLVLPPLPDNSLIEVPNRVGAIAVALPVLLDELPADLAAVVFSLMTMVSVSPTRRARRSSSSGRYAADWKMAPLVGGG